MTTTPTYDIHRDGIAELALPVDLDARLTAALEGEHRHEIADEINEAVSAKLAEHGVSDTGEWLGDWDAAAIVTTVLRRHATTDPVTIPTEHGDATLYYDATSDPAAPGWVLRYHTADQRHLDEILAADDPADPVDATTEAMAYLTREGIGAGRRMTTAQIAAVAGVDPASWRRDLTRTNADGTPRAPRADGWHDARTPWWWETRGYAVRAARRR